MAILLRVGREVLPAQAVADGEVWPGAPVVLQVPVPRVAAQVDLAEAGGDSGLLRKAEQKVGDRRSRSTILLAALRIGERVALLRLRALRGETGEGEGAKDASGGYGVVVNAMEIETVA